MKSLTCKQAQRWLDKVKEANSNAYKEIGKLLRRYDKYNDEAEVFRKINEVLLSLPDLTEDFNVYLEEGTKFVVNPKNQVKINQFVKFVRRHRVDLLGSIVEMVSRLSNEYENWSEMPYLDQGRLIKDNLRKIVKDDPNLKTYFEQTFIFEPDEILSKLKLDHLSNNANRHQNIEEEMAISQLSHPQKKAKKQIVPLPPLPTRKQYEPQKIKVVEKPKPVPIFLNTEEEKMVFKSLQKKLPLDHYQELVKIIHLYHLVIITKNETLEMNKFLAPQDFQCLKDIIESRQADRRKFSVFKPLPDGDFHNLERTTHSYVRMPTTYPNICQQREKNKIAHDNLNSQWISVPRGTEESFNIRIKNIFQINLIKSQDQRYQYDIIKKRLEVGRKVLERIIEQLTADPEDLTYYNKMIEFINMNIVQILYKNTSKEQKQEFQRFLATDTLHTLKVMYKRVNKIYLEMDQIRKNQGNKIWGDTALKNWGKSLDFKTNEFKRIEKIRWKPNVFVQELQSKNSYLQSRGRKRMSKNPFEDKKDFFSVLDSFENISRKERCVNRSLPVVQSYDLSTIQIPKLLPSIILAFQDTKSLELCYTFLTFYIDNTIFIQSERNRGKLLLRRILTRYLDVKVLESWTTSDKFNENLFFQLLQAKPTDFPPVVEDWIIEKKSQKTQKYDRIFDRQEKKDSEKKRQWVVQSSPPSRYSYLPIKNENNIVLYTNEFFYVFLRFLYILYERVIRMKEILNQDSRKIICFQLLYFSCIRSKESARFQQGLALLLQNSSYIFTTFYKAVESVCKSLTYLSTQSLQSTSSSNQAEYLYGVNRPMLQHSLTGGLKIVRCTFEFPSKLVYITYIGSLYNLDENNKELARRRAEITHKIDYYVYVGQLQEDEEREIEDERENEENQPHEKNQEGEIARPKEQVPVEKVEIGHKVALKPADALVRNQSQYCFEGNTIHMLTLPNSQDWVLGKQRKTGQKEREIELAKNAKILAQIL